MKMRCDAICEIVKGTWIGNGHEATRVVTGVSTDTRKPMSNMLFVPLVGDRFDGHDFIAEAVQQGATASLWQKDRPLPDSTPLPLILVEDTLTALQNLASAVRRDLKIPVIAVTGSNGKTTCKEFIASVLSSRFRVHKTEGNLNNHIGLPLTLLATPEEAEVVVVELGMNHVGEIALLSRICAPDMGIITNVGESHLEFLGSRDAIADAKLEICEGLSQEGVLFIHGDEPLLTSKLADEKREIVRIGFHETNDDRPLDIRVEGTYGISFISAKTGVKFQLPALGKHNALNALFAIQIGRSFGLTEEEIFAGLQKVTPGKMRLQLLKAKNGMDVINDAYNASPTSMRASIDLLVTIEQEKEKWVLLGDILELGPNEKDYHQEIGRYAVRKGVSRIFTIGNRGRWIAEGAKECDPLRPVTHFSSHDEAVQKLSDTGGAGVLLLVKASRGLHLETVVQELIEEEKDK